MVRIAELSSLLLSSAALSHAHTSLSRRSASNTSDCIGINAVAPGCASKETLARRDYFYIGGHYVNNAIGNLTYDQIYVEKITPAVVNQSKPVVFFHGGGRSQFVYVQSLKTSVLRLTQFLGKRCFRSDMAQHSRQQKGLRLAFLGQRIPGLSSRSDLCWSS